MSETQRSLRLVLLAGQLAVCRLPAEAVVPDWARSGELLALVRTRSELSVVCEQRFVPPEANAERGWRVLMVAGPLEFNEVGVLAALAGPLAQAGVSLFAISTYDTDYILIKDEDLAAGLDALTRAGHTINASSMV